MDSAKVERVRDVLVGISGRCGGGEDCAIGPRHGARDHKDEDMA